MSQVAPGSTWRQPILAQFTPDVAAVARLTVVADPDGLLTEQGVLDGIRRCGFELVTFEDHVAFRFIFERRFRQVWDSGGNTDLAVVLRLEQVDVNALPFDLLERARQDSRLLSFSIGELFPHLAPHVVADLDGADLDALYHSQRKQQPGQLGVNATRDFMLRHVFGVAAELIKAPSDLLRVLLRRHYRRRAFPPSLDHRFIHLLRQSGKWSEWPLEEIVPSRAAFFGFLEERWPIFVQRQVARPGIAESEPAFGLRYSGPEDLPFDHDDVRVYIDNLFIEGRLTPSRVVPQTAVETTWMVVGVAGEDESDTLDRFEGLLTRIEQELPGADANHTAWLDMALLWAEATALRWRMPPEAIEQTRAFVEPLHDRIESTFEAWMLEHFASLHNLPYWPRPVMVHHVPRFLAHSIGTAGTAPRKLALVVVDGLALDQWVLLREDLEAHTGLTADDGAVFAWVPTVTSVSRQSIFAGDPPFYFAASINRTNKEPHHWRRFWEGQGVQSADVSYIRQGKQEDEGVYLERIRDLAEHPKCRVIGVVVLTIDETIHGTVMGSGGMHASIRHWAGAGRFRNLVGLLHANGFEVYVTADHGNIEADGMGKPNVGAIADERGRRAHVFRDDLTRANVHEQYPDTVLWPQAGIPDDYRVLLAAGRRAFIPEGKRSVAHGGIALEEVIVPFSRIVGPE
jgi:hypothetical protein